MNTSDAAVFLPAPSRASALLPSSAFPCKSAIVQSKAFSCRSALARDDVGRPTAEKSGALHA
jgi:hypothetical protein